MILISEHKIPCTCLFSFYNIIMTGEPVNTAPKERMTPGIL